MAKLSDDIEPVRSILGANVGESLLVTERGVVDVDRNPLIDQPRWGQLGQVRLVSNDGQRARMMFPDGARSWYHISELASPPSAAR